MNLFLLRNEAKEMIPIIDLKAQYQTLKNEIDAAVAQVVSSGAYILGPEVAGLEKEIAVYADTKYAIGVNSGTDALLLALKACDIGPGDEVITTAFSFIATAEVIAFLGAKPVFVDINKEDFNINVDLIEAKITPRTRAVIPVHLYGQPAEMDRIMAIAAKHKLKIIEDCAQALGAEYNGKRVGSIGDIGCISFFPTKNLGAYGDGGMIVTNDEKAYSTLKKLHVHGAGEKYVHELLGVNSRLDALQAAILRVKLRSLDTWINRRNEIAKKYAQGLAGLPLFLPNPKKHVRHVFNQFTISTDKRNELQKYLKEKQIGTAIHYPISLPLQQAFAYLRHDRSQFPVAAAAAETVLSIPAYPEMTTAQIDTVIDNIKAFY
ncbi:MAG: DegT/DnrJ/EryC1/StrS family aminotransferase [bacterium]|nr:DegT/DnrJ/EryC1/StrS family aminotransferase [bacterium]